jgi:hypothetical protein
MKKFTIAFTAVMAIALLLTWISVAYAEDEAVTLIDTCFFTGYSTEWNKESPFMVVTFSGKIQPNLDGTCILSDSLGLEEKEIRIRAYGDNGYKEAYTMSSSASDDNTGGFYSQAVFSFLEIEDAGEWLIKYELEVDDEYKGETTHTLNVTMSEEEEVDIPLEIIPEEDFVEVSATDGVEYDGQTGEPLVETETIEVLSTQSPADNETLNLRLEILKVLENILAILFGK